MGIRTLIAALCLPVVAQAQDIPNMVCQSPSPVWTLDLLGDFAQFSFSDVTIGYDVVDKTIGQPGPWPKALTLIATGNTAIVILRQDDADSFTTDILTQRRNLPILLSGHCSVIK